MPRYIVKPDPDRDEYVEWSTIVDAPVGILRPDDRPDWEERFARADLSGSSASGTAWGWFGWADEWFLIANTNWGADGFRRVHRSNLIEYTQADLSGDARSAAALSEPLPDEDDE